MYGKEVHLHFFSINKSCPKDPKIENNYLSTFYIELWFSFSCTSSCFLSFSLSVVFMTLWMSAGYHTQLHSCAVCPSSVALIVYWLLIEIDVSWTIQYYQHNAHAKCDLLITQHDFWSHATSSNQHTDSPTENCAGSHSSASSTDTLPLKVIEFLFDSLRSDQKLWKSHTLWATFSELFCLYYSPANQSDFGYVSTLFQQQGIH